MPHTMSTFFYSPATYSLLTSRLITLTSTVISPCYTTVTYFDPPLISSPITSIHCMTGLLDSIYSLSLIIPFPLWLHTITCDWPAALLIRGCTSSIVYKLQSLTYVFTHRHNLFRQSIRTYVSSLLISQRLDYLPKTRLNWQGP